MIVDYGRSIIFITEPRSSKISGVNIGGTFLPMDLIRQIYEKVNFEMKHLLEYGQCKPIPNKEVYEYYQWDGNVESIKNVSFLKDKTDRFTIGGNGYGKYHLDYQCPASGEIEDVYPGDYIVNKQDEDRGFSISIYRKDDFEKKFIYK